MFYLLITLLLLTLLLNLGTKKYALSHLIYYRKTSKKIVEIGEEFIVSTTIENKKALPVTFLQVTETYPSELLLGQTKEQNKEKTKEQIKEQNKGFGFTVHKATLLVMPYQRVKISYPMTAVKRGSLRFAEVALTGGDLLGLGTTMKNLEDPKDIIVLPKAAVFEEELVPYGDFYGDLSVRRWIIEDPVLTVGIKEYTGSEPLKTLHWPSSLRSGRLMVKQFDYTSDQAVMVVLNIECSRPFYTGIIHSKIEKCISIARAVIDQFEAQGVPYSFLTNAVVVGADTGETIAPGYGRAHYEKTIEKMGRIFASIQMPYEELLLELAKRSTRFSSIVMITPVMLEPYLEPINRICQYTQRTVCISMDQECLEQLNQAIIILTERRN